METRPDSWDMATLEKLRSRLAHLKVEYFLESRIAEDNRLKEYKAAVTIQSRFRGFKVRAYLRYLNGMVTIIQKWWRGYQARKSFRSKVKTAHFIMKMNFYNEMAVRIQKRWRGYYVRKYVHSYYALKNYLEGVAIKNEIVRKELDEFADMKAEEKAKKDSEAEERKKDYRARKMHYLLSTEQAAGIYNSPYRPYPDEMEFRLQRARPLSHKERPVIKDDGSVLANWSDCRVRFSFPTTQPLPPIGKKKPQGPFRETAEVLQQRYKPLEPTLRVATSINSVDETREELRRQEWSKYIHDNMFAPFSSYNKNQIYEPSIHTLTDYKSAPYGTQHFRDKQTAKWISNKDFQTVFTSFPVFEKFGQTYSKAGNVV
ncbi:spermatogenesis-associated protein 17 [Spea bombifrons]|uniref:spermatogenesis-associated protein 17 n=1 Tax=Spea bombifrons TaxID=233779 RepID=UPI00234A634E|nr:spermatogenesis-associated protein 17 [Spea bombifrons]